MVFIDEYGAKLDLAENIGRTFRATPLVTPLVPRVAAQLLDCVAYEVTICVTQSAPLESM